MGEIPALSSSLNAMHCRDYCESAKRVAVREGGDEKIENKLEMSELILTASEKKDCFCA